MLYWLTLAVAVLDFLTGSIWWEQTYPYIRGIPFLHDMGVLRLWHVVLPAAFFVCMLKWAELGLVLALMYAIGRLLFCVPLFGLFIGTTTVEDGVEVPVYSILWEVMAFSEVIAYLVKKRLAGRTRKGTDRYEVVDIGERRFVFDKVTGERVEEGHVEAVSDGQIRAGKRGDGTFVAETSRHQIEVPFRYKIEDGRDGRMFIVTDTGTGESLIYYSVDEIPPLYRDTFERMLSATDVAASEHGGDEPAVERCSSRVSERLACKIKDGPEGRTFVIEDSKTGESAVYRSLGEMPPHHRDAVVRAIELWQRKRRDRDAAAGRRSDGVEERLKYTVRDGADGRIFAVEDLATGKSRVYRSLDEMPVHYRREFAHMLKSKGLRWEDGR